MGLAAVRDLREARAPGSPEELAAFETDVLAGFVLARAAAGLSDRTISLDVWHLEQARAWFGRPTPSGPGHLRNGRVSSFPGHFSCGWPAVAWFPSPAAIAGRNGHPAPTGRC